MSRTVPAVIAAVAIVLAGAWWFGVRHEHEDFAGPMVMGFGAAISTNDDVVTFGINPCVDGRGTATISRMHVVRTVGDIEVVGVAARSLGADDVRVHAEEGFPPGADRYLGTVWDRFDGSLEVDVRCGASSEAMEIIMGVRVGRTGGALVGLETDYALGSRTFRNVSAGALVVCGPAVTADEVAGAACSDV